MADNKVMRLNKVLRELNISLDRAVEFLNSKGIEIEARPTTKISGDIYKVLSDQFQTDANKKVASKEVGEEKRKEKEALRLEREQEEERKKAEEAKKQKEAEDLINNIKNKTIWINDRAFIDYRWWAIQKSKGNYVISRTKTNRGGT